MKKSLIKTTAFIACLAVLLLAVPCSYAAKPRVNKKVDFKQYIQKPATFVLSFFSFFPSFSLIDNLSSDNNSANTNKNIKDIKITGGLVAGIPSGGD